MQHPKIIIQSTFPDHREVLAELVESALPTISWNAEPDRSPGRAIREHRNRELAAALVAAYAYIRALESRAQQDGRA